MSNLTTYNSMNNMKIALTTNPIPVIFRFWTYLIGDILSVPCALFVLYYLIFDPTLRRALHNHIIIALIIVGLVIELISMPWILYRHKFGVPLIRSPIFYLASYYFDYAFYTTQVILFAWGTIERHILIEGEDDDEG